MADCAHLADDIAGIEYPDDYDPDLNGFGGWFVLVIINRILSLGNGLFIFIQSVGIITEYGITDALVILLLIVDFLSSFGLSVFILIMIFKRNIMFRLLCVIQLSIQIILILFGLVIGVYTDGSVYLSLMGTAGWIFYLYQSKRVKNTFIYNRLYPDPLTLPR